MYSIGRKNNNHMDYKKYFPSLFTVRLMVIPVVVFVCLFSVASYTKSDANTSLILSSIYSSINGGTDLTSLNQGRTTALCNASDVLLAGAGTGPSCDNASTPACGRFMNYEYNGPATGSQQGW